MPFIDLSNNPGVASNPTADPSGATTSGGVRQLSGPQFPSTSSTAQAAAAPSAPIVPTVAAAPSVAATQASAAASDDVELVIGTESSQFPKQNITAAPAAQPASSIPKASDSMPSIPAAPTKLDSPAVTKDFSLPLVDSLTPDPMTAPLAVAKSQPVTVREVEAPKARPLPELVNPTPSPVKPVLPELGARASAATTLLQDSKPAGLPSLSSPDLQSRTYNLNDLLVQVVQMGASDLHLTAGYRAAARVDGKLAEIKSQVLDGASIKQMLQEVVKNHVLADLEKDRDLDLSYQIAQPETRFRVNIFQQRGTLAAVFRVIPKHIKTIEELKLPQIIKEFTTLKQGLVLVTGPTGSGKTTTLAAMLNQINQTEPKHIITIEDPIEYVYPKGLALVDQRAVYIDTIDWTKALRAALRQDPDVVLIGEMRDVETMEAALQVAETGHLVFSTLHTNSAASTIDRIIDAFPQEKQNQVRTQLASVLMAVISQRLVPVTGGGRRAVNEVMLVTPAIRNTIRENKVFQIDNMIQTGAELGMITMEKSLAAVVREGVLPVETAQVFANKPEDLLSLLGKK